MITDKNRTPPPKYTFTLNSRSNGQYFANAIGSTEHKSQIPKYILTKNLLILLMGILLFSQYDLFVDKGNITPDFSHAQRVHSGINNDDDYKYCP